MTETARRIKEQMEKWPDWKRGTFNDNFATSIHSIKLEIGVDPMAHKVIVEACDECSKRNVCKFVDTFKRYADSVKASAEVTSAPIKTNVSCTEYSKKVATIRALNPQGTAIYNDYSSPPDNGTVHGNHD